MVKTFTQSLHLKDLALKKGIDIGVAVNNGYLNDKNYRKIITREFNIVTPEYELLFWPILLTANESFP